MALHFEHQAVNDLLLADLRDRSGIGNNESRREGRQVSTSITVEAALDDQGILIELRIHGWYPTVPVPLVVAQGHYNPSNDTAILWFENVSPSDDSGTT